ncbi:MAG: hypothetical protein KGH69_01120 [Candidatus Micrarchaeota archaeon]|nr:hypothetical protein [Candidatus Micrarchaeota archaeon]
MELTHQKNGSSRVVATERSVPAPARTESQRLVVDIGKVKDTIRAFKPPVSEEKIRKITRAYFGGTLDLWEGNREGMLGVLKELGQIAASNGLEEGTRTSRDMWRSITAMDRKVFAQYGQPGKTTMSTQDYDIAFRKLKDMGTTFSFLQKGFADCTDPRARELLGSIGAVIDKIQGSYVEESARQAGAIMLGNWYSASREKQLKGGTADSVEQEIADYIATHQDAMQTAMFLTLSKLGYEASSVNMPDLAEMMMHGRIAAAGFSRVILIDETPIISGMMPHGDRIYKRTLAQLMSGIIDVKADTNVIVDEGLFGKYTKLLKDIGKDRYTGKASDYGLDISDESVSRLAAEFIMTYRAIRRYEGVSREMAIEASARMNAFHKSKRYPGKEGYYGDAFYSSVTKKDGRHNVGFIADTLPGHGVAMIYLHGKNGSSSLKVTVVPEAEVSATKDELERSGMKLHAVHYRREGEHHMHTLDRLQRGEAFLAYALVPKGFTFTEKEFLEAVNSGMREKATDQGICMGMMDVILHMDGISAKTVERSFERIGIPSQSPVVVRDVVERLRQMGVSAEVIDGHLETVKTGAEEHKGLAAQHMKPLIEAVHGLLRQPEEPAFQDA